MVTINFKDALQGTTLTPNFTIGDIIITLAITFVISLFIYYIYKRTYSGVLYSKNYNLTLVVVAMVVSALIMAISGSLALSLGMVGALSIIRFRTPIKDPKDIAFLFWAISVGIINGVGLFKLSIVASILVGLVLVFFSKRWVFRKQHLLVLKFEKLDNAVLKKNLLKYCSKYEIRHTLMADKGSEMTVEVKLKDNIESAFLSELKKLKGVKNVMLFSQEGPLIE